MENIAFQIYLLFTASWLIRFTSRIPVLGAIRFDLILVCLLLVMSCLTIPEMRKKAVERNRANTCLIILFVFIIGTIPLVRWPGTVVKSGLISFIRATVFYLFTILWITSEKKLKIFIAVYVGCQSFRVFEPLYLHITEGYWGSSAFMDGEVLPRLAGAPHDIEIINPNGLAYIIVSIVPFYYYFASRSKMNLILFACTFPLLMYALMLTASRSGMICIFFTGIGILFKSKHKGIIGISGVLAGLMLFSVMSTQLKDRYLSIIDSSAKNAETAEGRVNFNIRALKTTFKRPIFGHGLSTSREINGIALGKGAPAHNLYIEVAQELGYAGLSIYLLYLYAVVSNFYTGLKKVRAVREGKDFLIAFGNAMQVWLFMSIIFSFASYGLHTPNWYLFGGLSVVLIRLSNIYDGKNCCELIQKNSQCLFKV